jgi:hypothetical protein
MLQLTQTLMSKGFIRIHPLLEKLTMSLRTAKVRDDWKLDKKHFNLALIEKFYQ